MLGAVGSLMVGASQRDGEHRARCPVGQLPGDTARFEGAGRTSAMVSDDQHTGLTICDLLQDFWHGISLADSKYIGGP
jgi:hypothetical protein